MDITGFIEFPSNLGASEIGWKAYNLEICSNKYQHKWIKAEIPKGLIIPISFSKGILEETKNSTLKNVLREILTSSKIIRDEIGKKQYGEQYEQSKNTVDDLLKVGIEKLSKIFSEYLRDGDKRIRRRLEEELITTLGDEDKINSDDIIEDIVQKLSEFPAWKKELNKIKNLGFQAVYLRSSTYIEKYQDWWDIHRGAFESIPCTTSKSDDILTQKIAEVYLSIFDDKGFKLFLNDIDTFGFAILIQTMEDVDVSGIIASKYEKNKIKFTFTFLEGFGLTINNPQKCNDVECDGAGYYQKTTGYRIDLSKEECFWYWDGTDVNSGEEIPAIEASNQDFKIIFDWKANDWIVIRADRAKQSKISPEQLTTLYNLAKLYFDMWRTHKKQEVEIKIEFVFIRDIPGEVQIVQSDAVEV